MRYTRCIILSPPRVTRLYGAFVLCTISRSYGGGGGETVPNLSVDTQTVESPGVVPRIVRLSVDNKTTASMIHYDGYNGAYGVGQITIILNYSPAFLPVEFVDGGGMEILGTYWCRLG